MLGSAEHRALARKVASRSVVLLRNEVVGGSPVLPLDPATHLAVLGRLADQVNLGDRGSSDVWDLECHSVLDGLRERLGHVAHDDGTDTARAARVATGADAAVVVVGYIAADEGEYIGDTDPALAELFPPADDPDEVARFKEALAQQPPQSRADLVGRRRRALPHRRSGEEHVGEVGQPRHGRLPHGSRWDPDANRSRPVFGAPRPRA